MGPSPLSPETSDDTLATEKGWKKKSISLKKKHGLHMRPAQKIVETADRFEAEVFAHKDDLKFNAKSILDMIEFAEYMVNSAADDDDDFVFHAKGSDAEEVLEALYQLVENHFDLE